MKKTITLILFLLIFGLFQISTSYPNIVENYYSTSIYPFISNLARIIWGWIPFSMGDLFYTTLFGWLVYISYKYLSKPKQLNRKHFFNSFLFLGIIYFLFHFLWGLNYNRITVAEKLQIDQKYTQDELVNFTTKLIIQINNVHYSITKDSTLAVVNPDSHQKIFNKTITGYQHLSKQYSYLAFENPSIKTSLLSIPLSYMGFGGYLNPFTNEAQVNSKLPKYNFPTTACHEMAHQIGIGSESEANLVGYLASVKNSDLYFQYSGYTYALRYCLSELHKTDQLAFKKLKNTINSGVWKNFEETVNHQKKYESPAETISKIIYGNYLKANHQKGGMKTYNNFVGLVINYYQKYEHSSQLF